MKNNGVRIKYMNFAPEAKENFVPTASESEFDTLHQLQKYNLNFPNYGNPCEQYSVVLDGSASVLPYKPQSGNVGFWSENLSGDNGYFEDPIVLTLSSNAQYSSQGITLKFDTQNGIYATDVNIVWMRGNDVLANVSFSPDSAEYTCEESVEFYDKIILTFYAINMPKNRLRLRSIDHGYGVWFEAKDLLAVKLIQEMDPISSEISINTADFTLNIDSSEDIRFQSKQALSVYFNGELKATTFVKDVKRKTKDSWVIQTEDYIGLLDNIPYYGGIYSRAKARDILGDIFFVAKVPYVIDDAFWDAEVTGHIPYTTCRDALMQVAFAIQASVDTSNSDVVRIFAVSDEIKQEIPLRRILQGQSFNDEDVVTGVEVTSHSYRPIEETLEAYKATENGQSRISRSGDAERILVRFSEPLHSLTIEGNGEFAVDDRGNYLSNANYAVIYSYDDTCVLIGKKYEHTQVTKRQNNPLILASDTEKIVSIQNATLVSPYNVDKVLEKCYNYFVKTDSIGMKIVDGRRDNPTSVGDKIRAQTEYLGTLEGRIIKQTFNLNGGIIIKDSVVR